MKFGFDAKWMFDGPASGRRIVRGLANSLCRVAGDHEIHLFLDALHEDKWDSIELPRAQQHYVWAGNNQLSNLLAVPRVADRLGLDVVAYQNFVPPSFAARHARIAFVHDVIFHESPRFFTPAERLYFSTVRPLTRGANRACTVSHSEKQRMVRYGFSDASTIDVVPYGIDDVFKKAAPDGAVAHATLRDLGVTAPFVLYVGRLTVRKNVDTLIRAMRHVVTRPLDLVIVGASDKTAPDLPALAASIGVADRVRFLGAIYDDRLAALYAHATAFCFPTWDESYGLPPLEAMAAGAPVIASDLPVLREMYGDAAVFADPHSEHAFARAIDTVAADTAGRADFQARGRARAAGFTWERAATLLIESGRSALEQAR